MEHCKSLIKNFERTLDNATAKVNLCFIRLTIKGSIPFWKKAEGWAGLG
jgi:hypothetical protein